MRRRGLVGTPTSPRRRTHARLYVVRHGQTDWNLEPARCQGWAEVPLNATGRRQARELGERLRDAGIELIVSSHLLRARQTAEELRDVLGHDIPVSIDRRLAEANRGSWQGRTFEAIMKNDPDEWTAYREHPESFRFPHGESLSRATAPRARRACATRPARRATPHCLSPTAAPSGCWVRFSTGVGSPRSTTKERRTARRSSSTRPVWRRASTRSSRPEGPLGFNPLRVTRPQGLTGGGAAKPDRRRRLNPRRTAKARRGGDGRIRTGKGRGPSGTA